MFLGIFFKLELVDFRNDIIKNNLSVYDLLLIVKLVNGDLILNLHFIYQIYHS